MQHGGRGGGCSTGACSPVRGPARDLDEGIGSVLADADGIQGVGDGLVAELIWRLLWVPLRAEEGVPNGLDG